VQEANLGSTARKEEGRLASAAVLEHPSTAIAWSIRICLGGGGKGDEHVSRVGGLSEPIRHRHAASRIPRRRRGGADGGGRRGGGGGGREVGEPGRGRRPVAGEEGEGQRKATSGGRQRETRGLGLGAGEAGGGRCAGLGVDGSGAAHAQRQRRGQRTEPPIHGSRRAASLRRVSLGEASCALNAPLPRRI